MAFVVRVRVGEDVFVNVTILVNFGIPLSIALVFSFAFAFVNLVLLGMIRLLLEARDCGGRYSSPVRRPPALSCRTRRLALRIGDKGVDGADGVVLVPRQGTIDEIRGDCKRVRFCDACPDKLGDCVRVDEDL